LVVVILLTVTFRIVPQYRRLVLFRLGHHVGERGPGLVAILPFLDRGISVDLREATGHVEAENATTLDRAKVAVVVTWGWRVTDPSKYVMAVVNGKESLEHMVRAEAGRLVASSGFGDLVHSPGKLALELQESLEAMAGRWGIDITDMDVEAIRRQ
jgi:regulator of protease activity HflC (stomatin/prohibitin superfamily)